MNQTDHQLTYEEFSINTLDVNLCLKTPLTRIDSCLINICLQGEMDIEIDLHPYHLKKNDIIELFPGHIIHQKEKSPDFKLAWIQFRGDMADEVLYRLPPEFIGFLKHWIQYSLPEKEKEELIIDHFKPLEKIYNDTSNVCRREIIINHLHNYYLTLYNKIIQNKRLDLTKERKSRPKELHDLFFKFLKEYPNKRDVAFFANQLSISPKYLSVILINTTGISSKELIDKFAITELKLRLRKDNTPLKEIASVLEYPSEAFLCKFFKNHTGLTPKMYRNYRSY